MSTAQSINTANANKRHNRHDRDNSNRQRTDVTDTTGTSLLPLRILEFRACTFELPISCGKVPNTAPPSSLGISQGILTFLTFIPFRRDAPALTMNAEGFRTSPLASMSWIQAGCDLQLESGRLREVLENVFHAYGVLGNFFRPGNSWQKPQRPSAGFLPGTHSALYCDS